MNVASFTQFAGQLLDVVGVVVILAGAVFSAVAICVTIAEHKRIHEVYKTFRHNLARSILIGLEFLVAGDLIRSVAGTVDLTSVVILAIIVAIRSLLGIEFEMEIEGRWPWQRQKRDIEVTEE